MKKPGTLSARWFLSSFGRRRFSAAALVLLVAVSLLAIVSVLLADTPKTAAEYNADPVAMVEAYRHVEAASVSDAIEQIYHQKRYMSHHMQAIFPTKFAGTALTVKLIKQENQDSDALAGMLQAIDSGGAGSVYDASGGWSGYCWHGRVDGDGDVFAWLLRGCYRRRCPGSAAA